MNQTLVFLTLLCAVAFGHWLEGTALRHPQLTKERRIMRAVVLMGAILLVIWSIGLMVSSFK